MKKVQPTPTDYAVHGDSLANPPKRNEGHTPTPWKAESEGIRLSNGARIPMDSGNAAFIVRAVNSHEELVRTLEDVYDCLKDHGELNLTNESICPDGVKGIGERIKQAIAKAEGK